MAIPAVLKPRRDFNAVVPRTCAYRPIDIIEVLAMRPAPFGGGG